MCLFHQIVISCLFAVALCAPQDLPEVELLRDERVEAEGSAAFSYNIAADNGIELNINAQAGTNGQSNIEGSYQ